jgi:hypothetical protein
MFGGGRGPWDDADPWEGWARLFEPPGAGQFELEKTRAIVSPRVTHLSYRVR